MTISRFHIESPRSNSMPRSTAESAGAQLVDLVYYELNDFDAFRSFYNLLISDFNKSLYLIEDILCVILV